MGKLAFVIFVVFSFLSCTESHKVASKLEEIKAVGNSNPIVALRAYDSIKREVLSSSSHLQYRYELLGVRLHDKADIIPTSDSCIRKIVPYFEKKGTDKELQEAYYYAGSVYRDLQDSPRSLEYYLKSADCSRQGMKVDSVLLRNCYSQLYKLYVNVQDYRNALWAARRECYIAKKVGVLDEVSLMHLANAYMWTDRNVQASRIMYFIMRQTSKKPASVDTQALFYDILRFFSMMRDKMGARACYSMLVDVSRSIPHTAQGLVSVGLYFKAMGQVDSCASYFQQAFEQGDTICKYDASKNLFYIFQDIGDYKQAYRYACEHINISTELDLGKRQELAATTNNQYQYYRNMEEEINQKKKQERMRLYLWLTVSVALFLSAVAYALHIHRKYMRLKSLRFIRKAMEFPQQVHGTKGGDLGSEEEYLAVIQRGVSDSKKERQRVEQELQEGKQELKCQMDLLSKRTEELAVIKLQLERVKHELEAKAQFIKKQQAETQYIFDAMRMMQLGINTKGDISVIKEAALGKCKIGDRDWEKFIMVVNQQYPGFYQELTRVFGKLKTSQIRVCYMIMAGFSDLEIRTLVTEVSRTTLFRWCNKYRVEIEKIARKEG